MSDSEPVILSSVLAYSGFYLFLAVVLNIILWASETYAGVVIQSSSVGWMPPILGAMMAGQRYGKLTGRKASGSYAWAASVGFVVVSFVLSIGLIAAVAAFYGVDLMQVKDTALADLARQGISPGVIAGIMGGVALLLWALLRFGFNFGAGLSVKAAAALAAKTKA